MSALNKVAIIMGSDSDLTTVLPAIKELNKYGVDVEAHIISAHRTPDIAVQFAARARENGFSVIIAAAGKAAHLAGILAANTTLPVIGIPIKASALEGMDALLATVQMPSGIPVATVAIDGAKNAAILALQIIGVKDKEIADKLSDAKKAMAKEVMEKDKKLQKIEDLNSEVKL